MTSEGQHAGQPAEAASGADGFPPDADDDRLSPGGPTAAPPTGWGPDAYPNSYGPPPYQSSGPGSPFVVPAVPVFGTPNGEAQVPGSAAGSASVPGSASGSARVPQATAPPAAPPQAAPPQAAFPPPAFPPPAFPQPDVPQAAAAPAAVPPSAWAPQPAPENWGAQAAPDNGQRADDNPFARPVEPHPYRDAGQPAYRDAQPAEAASHPYRSETDPYRVSGQSAASASVPEPAAPPGSFGPGAGQPGFTPGGPLPSRADRAPFSGPGGPSTPDAPGGFNGFVTASGSTPSLGSSGSGSPGSDQADDPGSAGGRPPGVSAFGGQRVRVPGAALTDLPDTPPPDSPSSGGSPLGGSSADGSLLGGQDSGQDSDSARQTSNGLPVRGNATQPAFPASPGSAFPASPGSAFPASSGSAFSASQGSAFPAPSGSAFPASHASAATPGPGVPQGSAAPATFPVQGGSGHTPGGFGPANSGTLPAREQDSGGYPAHGQDSGDYPARGQESGGFPTRRGEPDSFPARGQDSGGYPVGAGTGASVQAVAPPRGFARDGQGEPPSVPQPRTPVDPSPGLQASAPAVGTARPVSASASVPVASRVAPPIDGDELPPSSLGPKARVYGRPPQADAAAASPAPPAESASEPPAPVSPYQAQPISAQPISGQPISGQAGRPTSGQPMSDEPGSGPGLFGQPGSGRSPFSQSGPVDGHGDTGLSAPPAFGSRGPESGAPSGRATASARVAPPPADASPFVPGTTAPAGPGVGSPDDRGAAPYSEHTTDMAGRGRSTGPAADLFGGAPGNPPGRGGPFPDGGGAAYSEHTTDMAGRGRATDQPYVPAPALPSMHASPPAVDGFPPVRPVDHSQGQRPNRPRLGGVFPGPGGSGPGGPGAGGPDGSGPDGSGPGGGPMNRASVAPPGATETASWPGPAEQSDQGRFDAFKPDAETPVPEKTGPQHVRMAPILLFVALGAVTLLGIAIGLVALISHFTASPGGFTVSAGECVKRDGDRAVKAACGDAGAFEVVSTVDTREQCTDPGQPYVLNPIDGRTQVLCLKPRA